MEKISVIIPVYNIADRLEQSLHSAINQTWTNLQIICVDDGSSDNSLEVLNQIAATDSRVQVIHKVNEGVSIARNTALDAADGDYLLFLDGDDWLELDTCEKAIKALQQNEADLIMWPYIREFSEKSLPKQIFDGEKCFNSDEVQSKLRRRMIGLYGEELQSPENADALCTVWGKLYRADIIQQNKIRFYDIREIGTYEDGLFNLEVLKYVRKAVFIPDYLYHYRRNDAASITNHYNAKLPAQWDRLFGIMADYIQKNQLGDEYSEALYNREALSAIVLGINAVSHQVPAAEQIHEIKAIISKSSYRQAVKRLDLNYLPVHWKVFFLCAKWNWAFGLFVLIQVIQKIRGR